MKGFVGVTDNDWFAFLFTEATFTENSPPIRQKKADKEDGGQALNLLAIVLQTDSNKPIHFGII